MAVYSAHFSGLDQFEASRAKAMFGEVVCIELSVQDHYLGYTKRKSIHVPARTNAFWNLNNLHPHVVEYANSRGLPRVARTDLFGILTQSVWAIHQRELMACFGDLSGAYGLNSIQYYNLYLDETEKGKWFGIVSATEDHRRPLIHINDSRGSLRDSVTFLA